MPKAGKNGLKSSIDVSYSLTREKGLFGALFFCNVSGDIVTNRQEVSYELQ